MKLACIIAVAAAVMIVAGCASGPYVASGYKPGTTSIEHTDKIVYVDSGLRGKVRVVDLSSIVKEDGRLNVYAELENRKSKNLVIQVQTQFRDAMGRLSKDSTNWRTIVMPPHSSTSYESTSMNDKAKDFIIRVKYEKRH